MKILIVGNGYVGTRCAQTWTDAVVTTEKIKTKEDMLNILNQHKPDAVLNAAGVTGKPNVDWCETHQQETIQGNAILPWIIAEACQEKNIYLLHIGSGCIFYGKSPDPAGWREEDFGNPVAVYSKAKYAADLILSTLPNVGIARIRMPMDDIPSSRNIIDKLVSYKKIIDVENSLTVIEDMVRVFHELLQKKAEGIFHVTQPGTIKHREIIAAYKQYIDPSLPDKEWISEEELVRQGIAHKVRSSNTLQSTNLEKYGIHMRPAQEMLEETMKKYAQHVLKA